MRRYETIFITFPDLADEDQQNVFGKIKDLIPQEGGAILNFNEWGLKNLAYEIKKQTRGYYVYIDYTGGGTLVKELERVMRIDDRVMKYMTVLTDEAFDPATMATEDQATATDNDSGDSSKEEKEEQEETVTETNKEEGV